MPRGDRTGPWGLGPMTGRGMGYCSGFPGPGFMSPGPGFGFGQGFGRGFGRGFGLGRGRGFGRAGLGAFWGYPSAPMMPYGHPYGTPYGYPYGMPYGYPSGMSYGYPFPSSYGYPYGMGYTAEYPTPSSAPPGKQKK